MNLQPVEFSAKVSLNIASLSMFFNSGHLVFHPIFYLKVLFIGKGVFNFMGYLERCYLTSWK